ncbi:MAG: class I SAM-dependent methyltransferase [Cyanobacteriota bacterium]|jgi:SAM-dependent methyltransferase
MKRFIPFLGFGDRDFHLFGHPYALARTALRKSLKQFSPSIPSGPMLDVGCGTMPYRELFPQAEPYEGLEINQPRQQNNARATYFYDGETFPIESNRFTGILCSEVLEHSFVPELLLAECHRVLRPGGRLLLTAPFLWPEHEQPWDSQRFTHYGLHQRLVNAGFRVERIQKLNPGLTALLQLSIDWIESGGRRLLCGLPGGWPRKVCQGVWRLLWWMPYTILNLVGALSRLMPHGQPISGSLSNGTKIAWTPELYITNVVLAMKTDCGSDLE